MRELLTFDDVLIVPRFSTIRSRADVDLFARYVKDSILVDSWLLPVIASNMDTICEAKMAKAMLANGAAACLHRFWTIKDNLEAWKEVPNAWVSVGLGLNELQRAKALHEAGARNFILDVAHGANVAAAEMYADLKRMSPSVFVVVGNFATGDSVMAFWHYLNYELKADLGIDGVKVGVGPGSACTTRMKTGCGYPQLSAILDVRAQFPGLLIADGGCKTPGDVAKAIAAGADLVMLGGMLAGTEETPGEVLQAIRTLEGKLVLQRKRYRGSASKESYEDQNKHQSYITTEGEAFEVTYKGPVSAVLADIAGGLRSALSYVGAQNIKEFQERAELVRVTGSGFLEGTPHGKRS